MTTENIELVDKYDHLLRILTEEVEVDGKKVKLKDDFDKFFIKSNKTAGVRIRKIMQLLRKTAEDIRIDVQNHKKSI
jgi:hypothetical protein